MTKTLKTVSILLAFSMLSCSHKQTKPVSSSDPFINLEDIRSKESMDWVKKENATSSEHLKANPSFEALKTNIKDILASKERIPSVSIVENYIYNHWTDEKNPRGLWRRAPVANVAKKDPSWDILLDVDALGKIENESWVLKNALVYKPDGSRALLFLSRKGKDATVLREFDMNTKEFLKDGFNLPEAKMTATWFDKNTLAIGTDFGPNTKTDSGYPRSVRLLKRGQKLADAKLILDSPAKHIGMWTWSVWDGKTAHHLIVDRETFYEGDSYVIADSSVARRLPIPRDADVEGIFKGNVYFVIKSDLIIGKNTYTAGSLMKLPLTGATEGSLKTQPSLVFKSTPSQIYNGISFSKSKRWITVLNQVNPNVFELTSSGALKKLKLPEVGTSSLMTTADNADMVLVTYSNFSQPTTLYSYENSSLKKIRALPDFFNSEDLVVEQKWTTSKDGTKVPYYLVRNKNQSYNGKNPTLLYAYGGFEIPMRPVYSGVMGKAWLEAGGVYVLANIRGGGEFGPSWHQSALKLNRQRAFDDFYAVAEDLIRTKVTSSAHLGIMGGSNGGLLMGVAMTQRPDLFKAVLCEVPLLDMSRFHLLLAGASWTAEYGSPEVPNERDFLLSYSPYHNLKPEKTYPHVFITTSTEDDRVHPGHARKMAAKLKSMGKSYMYFENTEGGHGRTADLNQAAEYMAMQYVFLKEKLF